MLLYIIIAFCNKCFYCIIVNNFIYYAFFNINSTSIFSADLSYESINCASKNLTLAREKLSK